LSERKKSSIIISQGDRRLAAAGERVSKNDFVNRFVAEIDRAKTMDVAMDILADTVARLGFPRVLYAFTPTPRAANGRLIPPPVICRNFPANWERRWPQYNTNDPYYHACFDGDLTVDWTRLRREKPLSPMEREACRYMDDFGMDQGVTVPIHLPRGQFAAMSAIWREAGGTDEWASTVTRTRNRVFLIAHHFHAVTHRKFGKPIEVLPPVRLSPRETECLTWAARGKTAQDTAQILNRSVETVRLHLKNAMSKLGALNRAHAVAKAMQLSLLSPEP